METDVPLHQIPASRENNLWYSYTGSDTVLVFLHGIFSDSRGCWLYEESGKSNKETSLLSQPNKRVYWPELISNDPNFAGLDIFLGGFHTDVEAADYDLIQCSLEVYRNLNLAQPPATESVMSKRNLIFLGHSTGGIVARYLLQRNQIAFREKNVGVVLVASPSIGSIYATWFNFLSKIYKNELGGLLTEDNTLLADLDSQFLDMVYRKKEHIANLIGSEACENYMVLRRKILGRFSRWLPPQRRVVEPKSAWRYFGQGTMLRDTDHFSSVKPHSIKHPAHEFLRSFWNDYQKEFLTERMQVSRRTPMPVLLPPLPPDPIFGRDAIIAALKKQLIAGGTYALAGVANAGKTSIALRLAHDEDLRGAYPDGILWGDLSPKREHGGGAGVVGGSGGSSPKRLVGT